MFKKLRAYHMQSKEYIPNTLLNSASLYRDNLSYSQQKSSSLMREDSPILSRQLPVNQLKSDRASFSYKRLKMSYGKINHPSQIKDRHIVELKSALLKQKVDNIYVQKRGNMI